MKLAAAKVCGYINNIYKYFKIISIEPMSFGNMLKAEREAQNKMPPWDMFKNETDKYSAFDDKVRICILNNGTECLHPNYSINFIASHYKVCCSWRSFSNVLEMGQLLLLTIHPSNGCQRGPTSVFWARDRLHHDNKQLLHIYGVCPQIQDR